MSKNKYSQDGYKMYEHEYTTDSIKFITLVLLIKWLIVKIVLEIDTNIVLITYFSEKKFEITFLLAPIKVVKSQVIEAFFFIKIFFKNLFNIKCQVWKYFGIICKKDWKNLWTYGTIIIGDRYEYSDYSSKEFIRIF